jgi:competence protein ComEC
LAAGITAGDKRSVGSELSDTFQRVSLVHILVLSGYNITVVLGALLGIFAKLSRGPRLLAVLSVVALFIVIAGGAASAVRAGAMAFAAVYAQLYGRIFIALRVLIAVVCVMVLWNPLVLAYDPGFQLSVLATLGLVVFSSHIARVLTVVPERFQIREIMSATIATQLTVLPLLLFQNGTLSLVALPANLFALIAVPFGMAASAVAALAGIVFGTWGTVFALPAYIILRYIIAVADFFARIPYASITVPAFSPLVLVGTYAVLACVAIYVAGGVQNKNSRR